MQTDTLDRDGKCIEMNEVNYLEYKGIGHILSQYLIYENIDLLVMI